MSKYDARIKRLQKKLRPAVRPDGIDYKGPLDPLQVAILDELDASMSDLPGKVPPKDRSDIDVPEVIRICVGRALVDSDLPPEEVARLAPEYTALFEHYFAEIADTSGDAQGGGP